MPVVRFDTDMEKAAAVIEGYMGGLPYGIAIAIAAERERCARLAEGQAEFVGGAACEKMCRHIADMIRSGCN